LFLREKKAYYVNILEFAVMTKIVLFYD